MANTINYAIKYLPLLDEIYKAEAKTNVLIDDGKVNPASNGVGEIKVAKMSMDGLGDYSRVNGYSDGDVSLTWETIKYDKERSKKFRVDRLDNNESMDMVFPKVAGEFMRTQVIPETDAARIAKIAGTNGVKSVDATITDGASAIAALRAATLYFDNNEVDPEDRIVFMTPEVDGYIADLDSYKSKSVLDRFADKVIVPPTRMYTAVDLLANGYKKATGAKDINFLAVSKKAVACYKQEFLKFFSADQNLNIDADEFQYRENNLYAHVYDNKIKGVYVCTAPQA